MVKVNPDLMKKLEWYSEKKWIALPEWEMTPPAPDIWMGGWEDQIKMARETPWFDALTAIKLIIAAVPEEPVVWDMWAELPMLGWEMPEMGM